MVSIRIRIKKPEWFHNICIYLHYDFLLGNPWALCHCRMASTCMSLGCRLKQVVGNFLEGVLPWRDQAKGPKLRMFLEIWF